MKTTLNSMLFVPGNRPERFAKALQAGADCVIIDLEDAVSPADKVTARSALRDWLTQPHAVLVRVNAPGTEWHDEDLDLLALPGVAGVVVPKAERSADLARIIDRYPKLPLFPLIESGLGFERRLEIARAANVESLIFGTIDFMADLNMKCTEDELVSFRLDLVLASRLAGIKAPIDGVSTAIDDEMVLVTDSRRARRLGFRGKLCIHPRQVAVVNLCFMPSAEEVEWAQRIVAANAQSGGAAVAVDGKMVDRPVVLRAESILREADARR